MKVNLRRRKMERLGVGLSGSMDYPEYSDSRFNLSVPHMHTHDLDVLSNFYIKNSVVAEYLIL